MSKVTCLKCYRVQRIAFCDGLANGWPKCCGETMQLGKVSTKEIENGMAQVMKPLDALRSALRRAKP